MKYIPSDDPRVRVALSRRLRKFFPFDHPDRKQLGCVTVAMVEAAIACGFDPSKYQSPSARPVVREKE